MPSGARAAVVEYTVPVAPEHWQLPEETMPESTIHDDAVRLLRAILAAWAAALGRARVVRNLAVRWDGANPKVGVDPDVAVLRPAPKAADLRSLRTWLPDHHPPFLTVEVVSETNSSKDYVAAPEQYAASGTREFWLFDPLLAGPAVRGGPWRLQVWQRKKERLVRVYAGEGPFRSAALGAYAVAVEEGRKLRIADDAAGDRPWLTRAEAAVAAKEAALVAREAALAAEKAALAELAEERAALAEERAAKEAALARVAELEAKLARRR
jgi:Uma2 family endonuclease